MSHVFSSLPHSPVANSNSSPLVHSMTDVDGPAKAASTTADAPTTRPVTIEPALALELRLRWLEAIVLGVSRERKGKGREGDQDALASPASHSKQGETLVRLAESVQQRLDAAVEGNEGLRRFMEHYDRNAHLLTPSFALSGILPDPPTYENMTPEELEAFLAEMEPDIRSADRDMREIEMLEKKGVTGAGKLTDHEKLQPRLDALIDAHHEDLVLAASLEKRVATLMDRHATYVDTLSELFVAWDDTISGAEDTFGKMEREKEERRRLGLE